MHAAIASRGAKRNLVCKFRAGALGHIVKTFNDMTFLIRFAPYTDPEVLLHIVADGVASNVRVVVR